MLTVGGDFLLRFFQDCVHADYTSKTILLVWRAKYSRPFNLSCERLNGRPGLDGAGLYCTDKISLPGKEIKVVES